MKEYFEALRGGMSNLDRIMATIFVLGFLSIMSACSLAINALVGSL